MIPLAIQHHLHRALVHLRRKLVRRLVAHGGPYFSGVGAYGKPRGDSDPVYLTFSIKVATYNTKFWGGTNGAIEHSRRHVALGGIRKHRDFGLCRGSPSADSETTSHRKTTDSRWRALFM
jgi:hypothetical protein